MIKKIGGPFGWYSVIINPNHPEKAMIRPPKNTVIT